MRRPGGAIRTLTLFFFILWHPLSDVWWLPTNRHRLPTNRHRLPTNRHRLPTGRHRLPIGRHRRAYWTLRVFFFHYGTPWRRHRWHDGLRQSAAPVPWSAPHFRRRMCSSPQVLRVVLLCIGPREALPVEPGLEGGHAGGDDSGGGVTRVAAWVVADGGPTGRGKGRVAAPGRAPRGGGSVDPCTIVWGHHSAPPNNVPRRSAQ